MTSCSDGTFNESSRQVICVEFNETSNVLSIELLCASPFNLWGLTIWFDEICSGDGALL